MAKRASRAVPRVAPAPVAPAPVRVDPEEVQSLVCRYFCQGMSMREIADRINVEHGAELTREKPYEILRAAAKRGWLRYVAPLETTLSVRIESEYPFLSRARIVHSAAPGDVATQAAQTLFDIIRSHANRDELHIGFAGGALLQGTARTLAELLRQPGMKLPKALWFHAMVAVANDPLRDPNAFLTHFAAPVGFPFARHFVGLPAPGMVTTRTYETLRAVEGIREAFDRVGQIDVIVTSAGAHWDRGCSGLHALYSEKASPAAMQELSRRCIGDVLWRPFGEGPLEEDTGVRAFTLLELSQLPGLIAKGTRVVLALGPCGTCHGPKKDILRAVLKAREPLITHLIADSLTAAGLLG